MKKTNKSASKVEDKPSSSRIKRLYEVSLVLASTASEKGEDGIDLLKKLMGEQGKIKETNIWGKRALAYPIKKQSEGIYMFASIEADPFIVKEMNPKLQQSDLVLRYLILQRNPEVKPIEELKKE